MTGPALLVLLALVGGARADDRAATLPEPPAGVLVGGVQSRFDEPSSPADLAASAGSFLDASGKLRPGGALELGVRAFGLAPRTTAADYRTKAGKRLWANTFLSLATAQDADGTLKAAVGARSTLWQESDPYLEAAWAQAVRAAAEAECAEKAERKLREDPDPTALFDKLACVRRAYEANAKQIPDVKWNQSGTVLSVGAALGFPGGRLSAGRGEDVAAWLSQSFRTGEDLQLGVSGGWSQALADHPHVASTTFLVRGALARTRLRSELGVELVVPHGRDDRGPWPRFPILLGGEYRLEQGAWLSMDFGMRLDPGADEVSLLSQGTFRWGTMKAPSFAKGEL